MAAQLPRPNSSEWAERERRLRTIVEAGMSHRGKGSVPEGKYSPEILAAAEKAVFFNSPEGEALLLFAGDL